MSNFKKGDIVELKSGGPKMTVNGIVGEDEALKIARVQGYENGDVSVEYFVNGKLERSMFKQTSIKLSKPSEA